MVKLFRETITKLFDYNGLINVSVGFFNLRAFIKYTLKYMLYTFSLKVRGVEPYPEILRVQSPLLDMLKELYIVPELNQG